MLLVPTVAPEGNCSSDFHTGDTNTSPQGARCGTAARINSGGVSVGKSFRLCTAKSIRISNSAR